MKQYCRYCIHLHAGNGIWCDEKEKEITESTAKSLNTCSSFEFCPMDAFGETNGYRPRIRHKSPERSDKDLFSLNMIEEGESENG